MDAPRIRTFLIFDRLNDGDLRDELIIQPQDANAVFTIAAQSDDEGFDADGELLRAALHDTDAVIVICGEHTESSPSVGNEFRIALEEDKPYVLLWGRREIMCTKPPGAKPADAMYSWTVQILDVRVRETLRHPRPRQSTKSGSESAAKSSGETARPAPAPIVPGLVTGQTPGRHPGDKRHR